MSRRESSLELIKKDIHMNRIKCKSTTQMTIDNDINVPDVKPDISRIIRVNGEVKIQDIRTVNARAMLKGILFVSCIISGYGKRVQAAAYKRPDTV